MRNHPILHPAKAPEAASGTETFGEPAERNVCSTGGSPRREFLKTALGGSLGLATLGILKPSILSAMEPFQRAGKARLFLSCAAYSFRNALQQKDPAKRISLFQFIDFCADQGLEGAELTSYYFPPKLDEAFLLQVKRHAFLRGVAISGTAIGNNYCLPQGEKREAQMTLTRQWVDRAALLGTAHIRVFAGSKGGLETAAAKKLCIEALEEAGAYAGTKGIFLGLENHGGIVAEADDLLEIIRAVKSSWVGINLDTGNFHTDDPYGDLAKCAPYAVNVQLKVDIQKRGSKGEPTDPAQIARILRQANYQGYVALEYEAAPDPWQAVPVWLEKMRAAFRA
jgi:sugar phosphate isomerase/epimerase